MSRLPSLIFAIVFLALAALTQLLAYQQYKISKEKHRNELVHEAAAAKDRFRNILFSDVAAANTLAIIYKQYGVPAIFDSIASQILSNSRYAQALQITENGIVKNVYPDPGYKTTIGTNVNADPTRKAEEARAVDRRDIYFAGPRRLRFGDTGILGKVPIIVNNKVKAVATVLTRIAAIKKAFEPAGAYKKKFTYQLLKVGAKDTLRFPLSDMKPTPGSENIDLEIPEGDWLLRTSYCDAYSSDKFPYELSGMGIILSFAAGMLAFRKAREPYKLKKIIDDKTDQLAKSERYFRTLIETSSDAIVLLDKTGKVLYQTSSTEKILGYTLSEIQNIDGISLIHPDDRAKDNAMFKEILSNPGNITHQIHRVKNKNGSYVHIEGTYRNLLYDENVKAIVYSYKDITDKVLSEQQLARYNRELNLLNNINDIILRVSNEFQLYEEVCDCMVTVGNYLLAWICHKPNADAADQTVVPLVSVGATEYLMDAKIVLDDPELSNGPTAMALLTGKTVVNNDVANSTYFGKWIKHADMLGIRSSASLHLNLGVNKSGALIVYAGYANAFDEQEVSTLNRLAANLSIAVQNIGTRHEKESTQHQLQERVKELTTIYKVNQILQQEYVDTDTLLQQIAEVLPPGWQYPEACQARILIDGKEYKTAGYTDSTFKQHADFGLLDGRKGVVEVIYTASMPPEAEGPFLAEERSLINSIAEAIEVYFDEDIRQIELVESENRFRGAFEDSAIGIGLTSIKEKSTGRFKKVNRSLCEMLGYTEDELLSLTFMQITHPDDLAKDLEAQDLMLQGKLDTYRMEKRNIRKDGSIIWINLNVSLIKDKDNQPLYLVAQIENITEKVESQHKFQNLVENFIVGVYIIQNEKVVYVNPRIAEDMGYAEEDIINKPFEKFVYKDDVELVRENINERTSKDIKSIRYEARIIKKDGQPLWYEILGGSTLYRGVPALIGTMVNITERKAIYDELEKSEAKLKSIFDTTDVSYLLLDKNYNIVALNQHMKDAYIDAAGVVLSEGVNLIGKIPLDKREKARAIYDTVMNTNKALDYETTYLRNGSSVTFLANVKPINDGKKVAGICISSIDITERKNAIDQLKQLNQNLEKHASELALSNAGLEESEKRYSELFNFSPLPAWVADVDTLRFLDVNNAAVLHYGYSRDEFLSMTLKDIRPTDEIPNMWRAVDERSKQKDGIFRVVMIHQKKNGELINVEIQIAPIYYSGVKANLAITTDITERQSYIAAIEAQNERLREISWIQSHIVRAPLARIMGLIPMLENSDDAADEKKLMLDYILTSANELDEIVKTITDKSKIEDFQLLKSDGKGDDI